MCGMERGRTQDVEVRYFIKGGSGHGWLSTDDR